MTARSAAAKGKKVTSRQIRDRLAREAEGNVAIKITEIAGAARRSKLPVAVNCNSAC